MSKKIFLFISVSILSAAFLFSLNSVAIKAQNFSEIRTTSMSRRSFPTKRVNPG